ncbi:hypothetical protein CFOL_v3_04183, partial [Cephalotus follicularis]
LSHILHSFQQSWAVGTSILSKTWKYLFASLTNLHCDCPSSLLVSSLKKKGNNNITSFVLFVDKLLFLHNSSFIRKFYLICDKRINACHVNAWVSAALWCHVQELDLCVSLS